MKRLGLIGGIGTLAGVNLVWRMVEQCAKEGACKDSDFPDFVYINVPTHGTDSKGTFPIGAYYELADAIWNLNRMQCEVAAVLCNTAHLGIDPLARQFHGEIVDLVDCAVSEAEGKVAVLCSRFASEEKLFEQALTDDNCEVIRLTDAQQRIVDGLIADCIIGGREDTSVRFHELQSDLWRQGAQQIIIGCTELSMIPRHDVPSWKVIDAGFVAVQEALRLCR